MPKAGWYVAKEFPTFEETCVCVCMYVCLFFDMFDRCVVERQ